MVCLVWLVLFGLVNEDDLERPQVPSKVANAKLELHLGTIWVRFGLAWLNSNYKAISVQFQLQLPA